MKKIKVLTEYFNKRRERKCIAKQYALEKACVDYFNNGIPRLPGDFVELVNNIPVGMKGIPLLAKFGKDNFPIQAVKACVPFDGGDVRLYYGDFMYRHLPEWITPIKEISSERWLCVNDYPRPTRPALILCNYGSDHYEVAEYENKTWTTELCFPVRPIRYFVLDFLAEDK